MFHVSRLYASRITQQNTPMGFLTPFALAFAALGIPILIFYMLKLRREERVVSSTYLWQQVLQDREANAPWQKLRRNLLLLLQLLLLALLVFALARPYTQIEQAFQGNAILLLDASASMQAADGAAGDGRSRFEAARERAQTLIDGLGPNDTMTLIAVADTPHVLASSTNDKALLRQALNKAQVSNSEADWPAALILAAASAQANVKNTVIVLSDGGLYRRETQPNMPTVPGRLSYVPTGITAENLAIAALAVRDGPTGPQAFVRIANYGTQPAHPLVEIDVNGSLFDARTLNLPPAQEGSITLDDLPLDTETIQVRLPPDALLLDNQAWAVRTLDRQATAILVTPGNTFLERAVGLLPNLNVITVRVTETLTNATLTQPAVPPALYIFDRITPAQLPETGNLFFIAPPASTALFRLTGTLTNTQILNVKSNHALLRYIDLTDVHIVRALQIQAPWAESLIETPGGSLLLAGETWGADSHNRRVAILTFELHQSDLPLKIAFPLLIANMAQWLAPTGSIDLPEQAAPGMPVTIRPQMGVDQVIVTAPSGQQWTFQAVGDTPITFAQTRVPGLYTVEQRRGDETLRARFAVNLFSRLESDIAPRDEIHIGEAPVTAQKPNDLGRREWWRWPALAALSVLVIEWFAHYRGRTHYRRRVPHGGRHRDTALRPPP